MRDTHERPEGMDSGILVMTGISKAAIISGINIARSQFETGEKPTKPAEYEVIDVSWKIIKLIQSYVPYIKRRTWGEF